MACPSDIFIELLQINAVWDKLHNDYKYSRAVTNNWLDVAKEAYLATVKWVTLNGSVTLNTKLRFVG